MKYENERREKFKSKFNNLLNKNFLTIVFEKFVKKPEIYIKSIENLIGERFSNHTLRVMKKQNVPRKNIVDGISLSIYRRCGWEPPRKNLTEKEEYNIRKDFVKKQGASDNAIDALDVLCKKYENIYKFKN